VIQVKELNYQGRVKLIKKNVNKVLNDEIETRRYANKITDDFCKYVITEE